MSELLVFQHDEADAPGTIGRALAARGVPVRMVRMFAGDAPPPDLARARGIVSMGGGMSANDAPDNPFLAGEMRLLERAARHGLPVLGVCLGSQLLAAALGARVRRMDAREIGWHPVTLDEAAADDPLFAELRPAFTPFHWHGERFDLPDGAVALARSSLTPIQAFRFGERAYGLQFHFETTATTLADMLRGAEDELASDGLTPDAIARDARAHLPAMEAHAARFFGRWVERVLRIP